MVSAELSYFPCIHQVIDFVIQGPVLFDPSIPFKRSTFRNRMIISGADGPISLSIPVIGGRDIKSPIGEVKIDYKGSWQRDHFRTLESVYGNSPFFYFYKDDLDNLYQEKPHYLFEWNRICFQWMINKSKLSGPFTFSVSKDHTKASSSISDHFLPKNYNQPQFGPFLKYPQVFEDRVGFMPNLSLLDLLFSLGPQTAEKIRSFSSKPY